MNDLWFSDTEVFAYDWLFFAKRQSDGQTVAIWNDNEAVGDFVHQMKPVLVGFNYRDYDSYILKAILLGWEPSQVHHVSQTIVESDDRSQVWRLFNDSPWITLPPVIDLYHDITPRKGLKELEAMMGMPIVESSVSFDIDHPLTEAERDEVQRYCLHDVDATETLYDLRLDYLKSKTALCELRGIDPLDMLKHTNARIVSEALGARKLDEMFGKDEVYEVPDNVDRTAIPQKVLDFVERINWWNCDTNNDSVEFMFHGCPTVVGLGGIHAAVPKYAETASDERVILLQDIGSYYPSLIINNGYMSRAVEDSDLYKQFYDMRMQAKASGDKATADAAKLVLNTTYGTMKDSYSKMYDPMQATRVCLSGQLYIIDLIEQMFRYVPEGLQLIQLNTDGWIVSCPTDHIPIIEVVVERWCERTHFTVDTTQVERIVQRDVNNYVLRKTDGKVKAKGGTVACYNGPDLFYQMPQIIRNNNTIIDKAVVDYLLDGVPIADTINACDDIERFQIIAKAGRTFQKVVTTEYNHQTDTVDDFEVQRCNRVYATTDIGAGGVFKVKMSHEWDEEQQTQVYREVGRTRIPLTPDHCFIDNENLWKNRPIDLTQLDKGWYIRLATSKAKEFVTRKKKEKEQMAETQEPTNEVQAAPETESTEPKAAPKRRNTKKENAEPVAVERSSFKERLLDLQKFMAGIAAKVKFDGCVSNISYEYADTQQYKAMLAHGCNTLDLLYKLDMIVEAPVEIGKTNNGGSIWGAQANGVVTISDVHSTAFETFAISGFGSNVQAGYCNGGAQTNAIRNFILNNWNLDNKGREGDDQLLNSGDTIGAAKNGYVTQGRKDEIQADIAATKADEAQYATDLFANAVYSTVQQLRALPGHENDFASMLAEHFNADGTPKLRPDGKSTMELLYSRQAMTTAEERIALASQAAQSEAMADEKVA